jgi:hypothetical protein
MKIHAFLICFLLTAGCVHVPDTSPHADVDGWWADNRQTFLFYFKCDGNRLTGTVYNGPVIHVAPLKKGKIKGSKITLLTEAPGFAPNKVKFKYRGQVYDDEIVFDYTGTTPGEVTSYDRVIVNRVGDVNMTRDEIEEMLRKQGRPVIYRQWRRGRPPLTF